MSDPLYTQAKVDHEKKNNLLCQKYCARIKPCFTDCSNAMNKFMFSYKFKLLVHIVLISLSVWLLRSKIHRKEFRRKKPFLIY